MYEPIKDKDGNIDWVAENKRRAGGAGYAGGSGPQPVPNRPATSQITPKAKTFDEIRQDDIKYGQSWNLAVALVNGIFPMINNEKEKVKEEVEYWQTYFHEKLKNKC